jgi:hypothetical protein
MIWRLLCRLSTLVENVAQSVVTFFLYLALAIALAYHLGWLERWIWFVIENEAKKNIVNGANVTMGSFQIDWSQLLQGKITLHASNVVIHTPQRDEWQWESPLVARVGKVSVECNAPICIFHDVFLRKQLPIEAYTVIVSDVQVFVERRDSVINVYLLNPTLIVPPPPERNDVMDYNNNNNNVININNNNIDNTDDGITQLTSIDEQIMDVANANSELSDGVVSSVDPTVTTTMETSTDPSNEQAKKLVNEMLYAVQDLGRAATRGQLPGAIKQQGLELVDRLRGFRNQDNVEEGIRVMQQVGKVAVESFQKAPQLILPQPDDKKKRGKTVFCRVGRIVINHVRIFTKDSWIKPEDDIVATTTTTTIIHNNNNNNNNGRSSNNNVNTTTTTSSKMGTWNKPIFIQQMVVRASELSPPMSSKDENDLPAIYQNVDRVAEIVMRRLLAEMAKSNTGKLLSTAMGEVLSVMITNRQSGNSSMTIAAGTNGIIKATSSIKAGKD